MTLPLEINPPDSIKYHLRSALLELRSRIPDGKRRRPLADFAIRSVMQPVQC